ncbi:MAG: hypothetical protein EA398_12665 [Deltaproteobacteria bacterium]|nr:MAG: hypothetical protein EA398_12665 [Deltaproteobacteria bacterium]
MPVGIDLRFTPGRGGLPEVLALEDVERECPLCGFVETQRVFAALPFHSLTLPALVRRARTTGAAHTFPCPQCDETVRHEHTRRAALHYGFPGEDGILSAYSGPGVALRWQVRPDARFDVQALPVWTPRDELGSPTTDAPTEGWLTHHLRRPMSPKALVRDLLRGPVSPADEAHATLHDLAAGLVALRLPPGSTSADAREALQRARPLTAQWVIEEVFVGGQPRAGGFGAPDQWLADLVATAPARDLWLAASPGQVLETLTRILRVLPIGARLQPTRTSAVEVQLPGVEEDSPVLDPTAVAREAAATAITPSDATRLELDRLLLWQLNPDIADEVHHVSR